MMPMMGAMPVAAAPAQVTCQITYVIVILNYWVNISDGIGVLWLKKTLPQGFPTVEETIFIHRTLKN